jgi:hypothetical protein
MKTIKVISFSFLCFLLDSCVLDKVFPPQSYTIKGTLYQDCNLRPVGGIKLEASSSKSGFGGGGYFGSCITNADGTFLLEYTSENMGSQPISIRAVPSSGGGFGEIEVALVEQRKNLEGTKAYFNPKTTINIKLQTNRIFTQNDTLYIPWDAAGEFPKKFVAPQNGQLLYSLTLLRGQKGGSGWAIGYQDYRKLLAGQYGTSRTVNYTFPDCGMVGNYVIVIP